MSLPPSLTSVCLMVPRPLSRYFIMMTDTRPTGTFSVCVCVCIQPEISWQPTLLSYTSYSVTPPSPGIKMHHRNQRERKKNESKVSAQTHPRGTEDLLILTSLEIFEIYLVILTTKCKRTLSGEAEKVEHNIRCLLEYIRREEPWRWAIAGIIYRG